MPGPVRRLGAAHLRLPRHRRRLLPSTRELAEDHLSTPDYLFRYDTEAHWLSRTVRPLEWRPVRRMVGRWFLGSENLIRWSNRLGWLLGRLLRRPDVVVDVFIPLRPLR